MSIAKSIKVGGKKLDLAYITPKEKELLLAKDRSVGDITKKFHKGIPALFAFTGPDRGRDEGYEGSSGGLVGDIGDVGSTPDAHGSEWGGATYKGGMYTDDMGRTIYGPSSMGSGSMTDADIESAGGMEFGGMGVPGSGDVFDGPGLEPGGITETGARTVDHSPHLAYDDRGDYDPGSDAGGGRVTTGEGDEGSIGTDWTPEDDADYASRVSEATKSIEAAGPTTSSVKVTGAPTRGVPDVGRYKYREPTVKPGPGVSETERVRAKVDAGTPLSVSIRDHLFGEAGGAASEYKRLSAMDEDREFRENQLAQAQAFASKGMSFSTAQLDAETDMIRDAAKRRLITADEAAKLEHELKMSALKTAEPIELLAASGKLGDAGYGGIFTPGEIDTSRFMDSERFGLEKPPGFTGGSRGVVSGAAPSGTATEAPSTSGPPKDEVKDGKFTDKVGTSCDVGDAFENADGSWSCPAPSGGGER